MPTILEMCDGVAAVFATAAGITSVNSADELKEGISSDMLPAIQVYPDRYVADVQNETERTTFSGGIRQPELIVYADIFSRVRSYLHLDMKQVAEDLDAIVTVLEAQDRPPFFDVEGIKSFSWDWKRAALRYGDRTYAGGRLTLRLRVF